jgi:hypothetical protein
MYADKSERRAALGDSADGRAIAAALGRQDHVRALADSAEHIETTLRELTPATLYESLVEALDSCFTSAPNATALHYDTARLDAKKEAKRRAERVLDRVVEDVTRFAMGTDPRRLDGRPPLVVIGDAVVKKGWSSGQFAMASFITRLSRRCIVVIHSEYLSSATCALCGDCVTHPRKQNTDALDKGTVMCTNKQCQGKGIFLNRDLAASVTIGNLFFYTVFHGGRLGALRRVVIHRPPPR